MLFREERPFLLSRLDNVLNPTPMGIDQKLVCLILLKQLQFPIHSKAFLQPNGEFLHINMVIISIFPVILHRNPDIGPFSCIIPI